MARVSSTLPESTTMISSAQAALSMASAMCVASSSVMIVTVTRGTVVMLSQGRGPALQGRVLHGFQIDDRAVEIQDVLQLVIACLRQIALRLEHQEARGRSRFELALLGLEAALGQLARRPRAHDTLLIRLHLACGDAHLCGDLELLIPELRLCLALFQSLSRQVGVGRTGADRIVDGQGRRPARK